MCKSRFILCTYCAVLAAIALSLPREAAAQPEEEEYTIVVYQLGDLLLNVRDYPYSDGNRSSRGYIMGGMGGGGMGGRGGGGMGGRGGGMMGGGMFSVRDNPNPDGNRSSLTQVPAGRGGGMGGMGASQSGLGYSSGSAQITMDGIVEALRTVVDADSWDDVGGPGSTHPLGTSLLVYQTAAVHLQIEGIFKQLRKGLSKRRTVTIDARWLVLNSDELEELITAGEGGSQVNREVLATFTRRPSSIRGLTKCFNGQLVYLISGTRQNVVSSYIPVVGSLDRPEEKGSHHASLKNGARFIFASDGSAIGFGRGRAVGYQPVIQVPNFGTLLEIRPTLVSDDEGAIVDLKSTLTVLGEPQGRLLERSTSQSGRLAPMVDRVAIETQELATTLSVPLGRPVLVGGLTYVPSSVWASGENAPAGANQPKKTSTENPQLYLLLEVGLQ